MKPDSTDPDLADDDFWMKDWDDRFYTRYGERIGIDKLIDLKIGSVVLSSKAMSSEDQVNLLLTSAFERMAEHDELVFLRYAFDMLEDIISKNAKLNDHNIPHIGSFSAMFHWIRISLYEYESNNNRKFCSQLSD